ncbi:MAG TPA: hypothetical protein VMT16_11535 [Thermoanaerobaculia bacterium]|nr:hypothetical protein [Thermoanaerobaculia bacterium]
MPPELEALVLQLLAQERGARPAAAEEVLRELEATRLKRRGVHAGGTAGASTGVDRPETLLRPLTLGALMIGCLVPTAGAPRFLQLLATAALIGAPGAIGGRAVRWLRLGLGRLETLFVAGVLACGVAVCVGYALGTAGWLRPAPFRLVVAAVLLAACAVPVPAYARRPAPEPPSRRAHRSIETAFLWSALGAVLCGLLAVVWSHRLTPPGAFAFDDTSYHLSAVATWWQAGDLWMVNFAFGDPSTTRRSSCGLARAGAAPSTPATRSGYWWGRSTWASCSPCPSAGRSGSARPRVWRAGRSAG